MWIRVNPNPAKINVPDCVIRAVCIALNLPWMQVHDELCALSGRHYTVPSDDHLWGRYLYQKGFRPFLLPNHCPGCVTVSEFTKYFPTGIYIIGTGSHAVAVLNGDYYDSWDSGNVVPSFFWVIR